MKKLTFILIITSDGAGNHSEFDMFWRFLQFNETDNWLFFMRFCWSDKCYYSDVRNDGKCYLMFVSSDVFSENIQGFLLWKFETVLLI